MCVCAYGVHYVRFQVDDPIINDMEAIDNSLSVDTIGKTATHVSTTSLGGRYSLH